MNTDSGCSWNPVTNNWIPDTLTEINAPVNGLNVHDKQDVVVFVHKIQKEHHREANRAGDEIDNSGKWEDVIFELRLIHSCIFYNEDPE